MHIIPAVDIRNGKAVRLYQGKADRETIYHDNPVDAAKRWADAGATWLHVVDLDGAFDGVSQNEKYIERIALEIDVPVEVGGGIRSVEKAKRLVGYGVARVIAGTRALESREFLEELAGELPGQVNVGVDASGGLVAIKGWTEVSHTRAIDFIRGLAGLDIAAIIYTDISRDGALEGPNVAEVKRVAEATDIPVIASGGVSCVEDIRKLAELPLFGIISGKALYDGRLTLKAAMRAADGKE